MRSLVRTLGLLLIGFGVVFWLAHHGDWFTTPDPQPISGLPPAPAPAPSTEKKPNRVPLKQDSAEPQTKPSSKTVLIFNHPSHTDFKVVLHNEGGWFDTGIPITARTNLNIWCYPDTGDASMCAHPVEIKIADKEFQMSSGDPDNPILSIETVPSDAIHPLSPVVQPVTISESSLQTLKFRVVGDGSSDELHYMVRIEVKPVDQSEPQFFTQDQQREQSELAKWGAK